MLARHNDNGVSKHVVGVPLLDSCKRGAARERKKKGGGGEGIQVLLT